MSFGDKIRKVKATIRDIILGATVYEMIQDLQEKRQYAEYMLMLVSIGDMLGYPVASYYRLRLLPFWMPSLQAWKQFLLREKDVV